MKLFCTLTPSHELLFHSYFRPTLSPEFDLQVVRADTGGPGDFLAPDWSQAMVEKGRATCESLEQNRGDIIVWSDVDLQFFNLRPADLQELLVQSGCDILFQPEWRDRDEINGGFFVCRCTDAVIALFAAVFQDMQRLAEPRNQPAINARLQKRQPQVAWGYLPFNCYAWTHGWPPPRDLVLHHANGTVGKNSVVRKIAQLEEVRAYLATAR